MLSSQQRILQEFQTYLNKFYVERFLGSGFFGEVYKVINTAVGRVSALKAIRVSDPLNHKAIVEAQAQNICSHDNVVKIYGADVVEVGNVSFVLIEMEFIEFGSLEDRLRREFVPICDSVSCMKDVLFALHHAHGNGIIHRDVKPGNILLAKPRVKLSDFGVAYHAPSSLSAMNLFYQPHGPPEAFSVGDVRPQHDVFAAGVTLFRAVNNIQDWSHRLSCINDLDALYVSGRLIEIIGFQSYVPTK